MHIEHRHTKGMGCLKQHNTGWKQHMEREGGRERERDRGRDRDRQTEIETERDRDRETERVRMLLCQ